VAGLIIAIKKKSQLKDFHFISHFWKFELLRVLDPKETDTP